MLLKMCQIHKMLPEYFLNITQIRLNWSKWETLPAQSNDLLLIAGVPDVLVEAGQRPGQGVGPDALLDAVGLGEKVVGVAPAAAEEELLADAAAGVVEEPSQPSVAHPLGDHSYMTSAVGGGREVFKKNKKEMSFKTFGDNDSKEHL